MSSVNNLNLNFSNTFTTIRSSRVDLEGMNGRPISVQITWSALTGTLDATVSFQASNDGTNWTTIASKTLDSPSSNYLFEHSQPGFQYFSVLVTKNNVLSGTLTSYYFLSKGV